MKLDELLEPDVMFNKRLAEEYAKDWPNHESHYLNMLRYDLTWRGEKQESIEGRMGVEFSDIRSGNYIRKAEVINGWHWQDNNKKEIRRSIKKTLNFFGVSIRPDLDDYIDAGEKAINEIGFPYVRFSTEKVKAYMHITEDQQRVFSVNLHDLAIGHLGEQAMREFLIKENKEFISRAFLYHNSNRNQEEKDITIFTPEEQSLGVRCQREFSGSYLYSKKRIKNQRDKIADYVVFFNHFAHHIFYVTGIVEKDFFESKGYSSGPMEEFLFPERNHESVLHSYTNLFDEDIKQSKKELNERLRKRISFKELMKKMD